MKELGGGVRLDSRLDTVELKDIVNVKLFVLFLPKVYGKPFSVF